MPQGEVRDALSRLAAFTQHVRGDAGNDALAESVIRETCTALDAQRAEFAVVDQNGALVVWRGAGDGAVSAEPSGARNVVQEALRANGQPLLAIREGVNSELAGEFGARTLVAAALAGHARNGYLAAIDRPVELGWFGSDDARLLAMLADHTSTALYNAQLVAQLEYEADHDDLTYLPNWRLLSRHAVRVALDGDGTGTLMLFNLDRFQEVNNTLGYANGDRLLTLVARRLAAEFPEPATVARLGADEFAVLIPGAADARAATGAARAGRDILREPFDLGDAQVTVTATVGIALVPEHATEPDTMRQRADTALYLAKRSRTEIGVYDAARDPSSARRLTLVTQLRHAIDAGQLVLYYQPKVSLRDGHLVGAEALVRWIHPEFGFLPPDEFIPLAENTGLIVPLTMWAIRRALVDLQAWQGQGLAVNISVNITVRSLLDGGFPERVSRLIDDFGVPPDRLTLEMTESGVMADPDHSIAVLANLRNVGVHLSVDDFGTGYSSFTYLRRLPMDEMKIDRSFVISMLDDGGAIVKTVLDMATSLGLNVVAEGVEDLYTAQWLADLGCDVEQGFHLAKPLSVVEATDWFRSWDPTKAVHPRPGSRGALRA